MSILDNYPYRDMTPEEKHLIIRRAHAERAEAIRRAFAGLLWWRRKSSDRYIAAGPSLKVARER
jgi:hypothetical protein